MFKDLVLLEEADFSLLSVQERFCGKRKLLGDYFVFSQEFQLIVDCHQKSSLLPNTKTALFMK